MKQKERQERSREEIYQAALDEFGTEGYENVTMDRICASHGISKGMMYHYYSGKDELFLLCVERTFADLKTYLETHRKETSGENALEAIRNFFLLREYYFEEHPRQKRVFGDAVVRPPKHLVEAIRKLRAPLRELNHRFLEELTARMQLRPGLDAQKAARCLEAVEYFFRDFVSYCQPAGESLTLHTMLESSGELLEMILFGVMRQDGWQG